jgi:hypothetical protein
LKINFKPCLAALLKATKQTKNNDENQEKSIQFEECLGVGGDDIHFFGVLSERQQHT